MNLDAWFKPKESILDKKLVKYFYLDTFQLSKNDGKNKFAKWLDKLPDNCNFKNTIKLRGEPKIEVILCGNINYNDCDSKSIFSDLDCIQKKYDYKEWSNAPYLKSLLQKCIRRHWTDKAIRTAYHLMRLDMNEFLRRFPIIVIEDSGLHMYLSTICWFMAAYSCSEFQMLRSYIYFMLGCVYIASEEKRYDRVNIFNMDNNVSISLEDIIKINTNKSKNTNTNYEISNLIFTILLRRSYGGMRGDKVMLTKIIKYLLIINNTEGNTEEKTEEKTKEKTREKKINFGLPKIRYITILNYLSKKDAHYVGADFHCFPNIINDLKFKFKNYSESEIKTAIWNYSSGINYRFNQKVVNDKKYKKDKSYKIWKEIELSFREKANKMIFSCT